MIPRVNAIDIYPRRRQAVGTPISLLDSKLVYFERRSLTTNTDMIPITLVNVNTGRINEGEDL